MQNIYQQPYGNMFPTLFSPPQIQPQVQPQNTQTQLIKVNGLEGAKAYQMGPNSSVALFHESEDILYVKVTDGAGFPTIRTFRFEPFEVEPEKPTKYVTMEEFEKFKREIANGKQSIRKTESKPAASAE